MWRAFTAEKGLAVPITLLPLHRSVAALRLGLTDPKFGVLTFYTLSIVSLPLVMLPMANEPMVASVLGLGE